VTLPELAVDLSHPRVQFPRRRRGIPEKPLMVRGDRGRAGATLKLAAGTAE
jgi:hypothetical protein